MGRPKLNLSLRDKIKIISELRKAYMVEVEPHYMNDEELFVMRYLNSRIGAFKPFKGWTCRYESNGNFLYFHPRRACRWGYGDHALAYEEDNGIKAKRIKQ